MPELQTVALWGPSSSGKTAFLAELYSQRSDKWEIFPTEDSLRFLDRLRPDREINRFPPVTVVGEVDRVAYTFQNKSTKKEVALVVEDRAGKESEILTEYGKKRLNDALGIILLFDPEDDVRVLEHKVEQTLSRLNVAGGRGTRKDERPYAICLSKSDLRIHTPEDLNRAVEKPREFVLEKITPEILGWVSKFCNSYELFPISSVGVRLRHGVIEPVVFYDEELRLRMGSGGEPINLMRPFAWLFDRLPATP